MSGKTILKRYLSAYSDVSRINKHISDQNELYEELESQEIDKNIIKIMKSVPRELFVPIKFLDKANENRALSISPKGRSHTISQPFIVAYMLQNIHLPDIRSHSHIEILEVGTGSGYNAALLFELLKKIRGSSFCIHTAEINPFVTDKAIRNLSHMYSVSMYPRVQDTGRRASISIGNRQKMQIYHNNAVRLLKLSQKRFNTIICTASSKRIDDIFLSRLKDRGVLMIPVKLKDGDMLVTIQKNPLISKNANIHRIGKLESSISKMEKHETILRQYNGETYKIFAHMNTRFVPLVSYQSSSLIARQ